jgi:hypothetical protein
VLLTSYLKTSLFGGILFGILDGLINANPVAIRLYEAYKPIAKSSINYTAGTIIDILYGFILGAVYLLLYASLPGDAGITKGISFGLIVWFFRVVMSVASQWMMYNVPGKTLIYSLLAGLGEMLILGIFFGAALNPVNL